MLICCVLNGKQILECHLKDELMSGSLAHVGLDLSCRSAPSGLESVCENPPQTLSLHEQVAIRQAYQVTSSVCPVDYIFFRRFGDNRSSQVAAYVIDNANRKLDDIQLAELHHKVWLSGASPLLYVGWLDRVDILSCASKPVATTKANWKYKPDDCIQTVSDIDCELARRYSAFRLADGTFWEDERNVHLIDQNKSAHKMLIDKVRYADIKLNGANNPLARRLLLLSLLVKYLEDRGVFEEDKNWFNKYHREAKSFLDVMENASVDNVLNMFRDLEKKFNGDIFGLPKEGRELTPDILQQLVNIVDAKIDKDGQRHFWDIYSFDVIPVEVLSHIYQHFADKSKGAIFTPPLLVNLMLDQALPLDGSLTGCEKIFDPTCGSGIFLVAAFKRMIHIWCKNNSWNKPTPIELKNLLSNTIYGVEIQPEALDLTAFSLALAICDALKPNIIWNDLKFAKLKGNNLFSGDFDVVGPQLSKRVGKDKPFDVIVGNPPFKSELTDSMKSNLKQSKASIPDNQIAYYILEKSLQSYLSEAGKICLIQPAGFLYNENTFKLRGQFFTQHTVDSVLDFVSIRGLFKGADTKIVVISARPVKPNEAHIVHHLTFRRTFATNCEICFEFDHYDFHGVPQSIAVNDAWIWRINLLGGGRLLHLARRLSSMPTLAEYCISKGWEIGEGFIIGDKAIEAEWLAGMNFLPTEALTKNGIDLEQLDVVKDKSFHTPNPKSRYTSPLFLIKENADLPCAFWNNGDLAYKAKIVGIHASKTETDELKDLGEQFVDHRSSLKGSLYLLGKQVLVGKSTAILLSEIAGLPWPQNNTWDFAQWEEELLSDITDYMVSYVRHGQDSKLLQCEADRTDIESYQRTFLRLINKTLKSVLSCGYGISDGLMFQAFSFNGSCSTSWLKDSNWLEKLRNTVFREHGIGLRSVRIVRIYDNDSLVLVKPSKLRYWINSTAIRDVDEVLSDIIKSGK